MLISKVESRALNEDDEKSKSDVKEEPTGPTEYEIRISTKIQYMGQSAQTIAFVKREDYTLLDLREEGAGEPLSRQMQIVNLGFTGENSSIFELT